MIRYMKLESAGPTLVSACLLGSCCRYDGKCNINNDLSTRFIGRIMVLICPEVMGGLPVPRPPANILGGTGKEVLAGQARILTANGADFTEEFLEGARLTKRLCKELGIKTAILKSRSPSCGKGEISQPDGSLKKGNGVTTELLLQSGIKVISCEFENLPKGL